MNHFFDGKFMSISGLFSLCISIFLFTFPLKALSLESLKNNNVLCFSSGYHQVKVCESHPLGFSQRYIDVSAGSKYSEFPLKQIENSKATGETNIINYIQTPAEDKDNVSIYMSILAILISIGVPVWQRWVQKNDSINDGYWVREVVMPKINNNIFNLCSSCVNKLGLNEQAFTTAYKNDLLPLLNELRDSFSLLTAFPNAKDCHKKLNDHCDGLEDNINDHVKDPLNKRKEDISAFQISLTKELISIHKKVS